MEKFFLFSCRRLISKKERFINGKKSNHRVIKNQSKSCGHNLVERRETSTRTKIELKNLYIIMNRMETFIED